MPVSPIRKQPVSRTLPSQGIAVNAQQTEKALCGKDKRRFGIAGNDRKSLDHGLMMAEAAHSECAIYVINFNCLMFLRRVRKAHP